MLFLKLPTTYVNNEWISDTLLGISNDLGGR
jgi:hypothetical protein